MAEPPPPPPRRPEGRPAFDSDLFDQETPVRSPAQSALDAADSGSNPFMAGVASQSAPTNPFLSAPMAAPSPSAPRVADGAPVSTGQPRAIRPPAGAPLIVRVGAASPEVRDAHAEFRRGAWQRPLILVLVAGAVVFGMTLLPSEDKATPSPEQLAKSPPAAVIGRSLPPGRTTDEDVRAAEEKQLRAKPEDEAAKAERPSDIPAERDFAGAFKAAAN
jgi:hypothetical protein